MKGSLLLLEDLLGLKRIAAISKNVYFDVLDDIVKKCNNTVHRTIKMKPIDVKDNTYIDSKK